MPRGRPRPMIAALALAALILAASGVMLAGRGSASSSDPATSPSEPATEPASTLASIAGYAFPGVAADGSAGFDAVWDDGGVVTAHWSSATRAWTPAVHLSASRSVGDWAQIGGSPSGAAALASRWTAAETCSPSGNGRTATRSIRVPPSSRRPAAGARPAWSRYQRPALTR